MKIGIGLSFYQDYSSLERMFNSLRPYPIDLIIAVDGKYREWPDPTAPGLSNCKKFLNIFRPGILPFRYFGVEGLTQIEKRNLYFDYCNKENIDLLLVMDSDEFIVHDKTDWHLFIKDVEQKIKNTPSQKQSYGITAQGFDIQGNSTKMDGSISYPLKLFYKPSTLEYYGNHYTIRNKHTKLLQSYNSSMICEHIMIGHDHALRDPDYLEQNHEYQQLQMQYEKEGRYKY